MTKHALAWCWLAGSCAAPQGLPVDLPRADPTLAITAPRASLYRDARYVDSAYRLFDHIEELQRAGLGPWRAIRQGLQSEHVPRELELEGVFVRRPAREARTAGAPEAVFSGYVARRGPSEERVVVLHASWTRQEWVRDLESRPTPWPRVEDARVHERFRRLHRELQLLDPDLEGEGPRPGCSVAGTNDRSTVVVGHGLGAALATLYAVDCAHNGPGDPDRIGLLTLGSPLVGDVGFARAARRVGQQARVYNHADAVVWGPPSARGFRHVGTRKQRIGYTTAAYGDPAPDLDDATAWSCHHDHVLYLWFLERSHPRPTRPGCFE